MRFNYQKKISKEHDNVELQTLQGKKVVSTQKTGKAGMLTFTLPKKNSFEVYKYFIK